ncbi:hypothetical protein HK103_000675, partial [Boothiomyces macroporosus]
NPDDQLHVPNDGNAQVRVLCDYGCPIHTPGVVDRHDGSRDGLLSYSGVQPALSVAV